MRVSAGMHDLRNLYVRANACVACHQNLAPDVVKAGHPELFFELDGQSVAEPKHWRDEKPWTGVNQWLTGQAVALRELSWALMSDQNNVEPVPRWNGLAWLCATAVSAGNIPSAVSLPSMKPDMAEFARMKSESDALARRASGSDWDQPTTRSLLNGLASVSPEFHEKGASNDLLGQRAKRLVLALDRLVIALNENCGACLKVEPEVNQLFQDVKTLDGFDPVVFATHLDAFREATGSKK